MARSPAEKLSPTARQEAVELAIREEGWDHALALRLARKTGWSWRTIYRDREAVIARLVEEELADLPRRRAAFLADLRAHRGAARRAGAHGPAAKLLSMECQVLGLDRVPLPVVEEAGGELDTSLEGVLTDTRRLRRRAEAGDSYVAAEKLLEREASLVHAIQAREQAKREAELEHLGDEAVLEALVANVGALPALWRERLRAALGDR